MDRYMIQARTGERPPVKTVYLVRHGQSTHNAHALAAQGADLNDPRYIDAPLTALGEAQARALAPELRAAALPIELVVTSPLIRATQTCLLACAASGLPNPVVSPLCAEYLAFSGDIGSPVDHLQRVFPALDYALVPQGAWWWSPDDAPEKSQAASLALLRKHPVGAYKDCEPKAAFLKRVNDFRVWLLERPEKTIIVFAHGVFLTHLVDDGTRFRNAEVKKWKL